KKSRHTTRCQVPPFFSVLSLLLYFPRIHSCHAVEVGWVSAAQPTDVGPRRWVAVRDPPRPPGWPRESADAERRRRHPHGGPWGRGTALDRERSTRSLNDLRGRAPTRTSK